MSDQKIQDAAPSESGEQKHFEIRIAENYRPIIKIKPSGEVVLTQDATREELIGALTFAATELSRRAPTPAAPASAEMGMRGALEKIADAESDMCGKCDGSGRVWADGRAHSQGYSGPLSACPPCGGTGRIDSLDLREIARAALRDGGTGAG